MIYTIDKRLQRHLEADTLYNILHINAAIIPSIDNADPTQFMQITQRDTNERRSEPHSPFCKTTHLWLVARLINKVGKLFVLDSLFVWRCAKISIIIALNVVNSIGDCRATRNRNDDDVHSCDLVMDVVCVTLGQDLVSIASHISDVLELC